MVLGDGPGPRELSERLTELGPFFAVHLHPAGAVAPAPWRPMFELVADPPVLAARIDRVRAALAASAGRPADEVPLPVAASITQLGLVARLIAPALASAALGPALGLTLADCWWRDELGGPFPLSLTAKASNPERAGSVLGDAVEAVTGAVAAAVPVSPRVLRGNVASAVNGAAAMLAAASARHWPALADRGWQLAAAALAEPAFDGESRRLGPNFRRRSCCLIYRVAVTGAAAGPAGVCGDCVLRLAQRPVT